MAEPWSNRNEDDAGSEGGESHDGQGQDGHGERQDWMQHSGEIGKGPLSNWWNEQWTTGEWHRTTGAPTTGGVIAPPKTYPTSPLWPPDDAQPLPPSSMEPPYVTPQLRQPPYLTPVTARMPQQQQVYQPPQYLPGGPAGGLAQQRFGEEQRMYSATQAGRLTHRTGAPLDVTRQAMHTTAATYVDGRLRLQDRGMAFYHADLDEHLLMLMTVDDHHSSLTFASSFLNDPRVEQEDYLLPAGRRESFWHSVIEPYALRRLMTTWAWARWYYWRDVQHVILDVNSHVHVSSGPMQPDMPPMVLAAGWWPAYPPQHAHRWPGRQGAIWRPEHTRYYDFMWRLVSDALAHRFTLEALTAEYLMVEQCPPWRSAEHHRAIEHYGRKMDIADVWPHYVRMLAQEAGVPEFMIRSRLFGAGGNYPMNNPDCMLGFTKALIIEYPELTRLRANAAWRWGLDPKELALWILEPATMLLPPRVRHTG